MIFLPVFRGTEDVNDIQNLRSTQSLIIQPNLKNECKCPLISLSHWYVFQVIPILQFDEADAHRNNWIVPVFIPPISFSLKKLLIDSQDMYN